MKIYLVWLGVIVVGLWLAVSVGLLPGTLQLSQCPVLQYSEVMEWSASARCGQTPTYSGLCKTVVGIPNNMEVDTERTTATVTLWSGGSQMTGAGNLQYTQIYSNPTGTDVLNACSANPDCNAMGVSIADPIGTGDMSCSYSAHLEFKGTFVAECEEDDDKCEGFNAIVCESGVWTNKGIQDPLFYPDGRLMSYSCGVKCTSDAHCTDSCNLDAYTCEISSPPPFDPLQIITDFINDIVNWIMGLFTPS